MKHDITLITGNPNKVRDISDLMGIELKRLDLDLPEIQSTDVAEVVKFKAIEAYKQVKSPVLVDDAGLTFEHWDNLPGALIKFFITNVGCDGLIEMMRGVKDRNCYMECAMAYCDQDGAKVYVGRVDGTVALEQRGTNGWGYDTIVIPNGETTTCAEMTGEKYWKYSSRKRAVDILKQELK